MGDDPRGSGAWVVDPARYLESRPAEHGARAPVSQHLEMADEVHLAVDLHLPEGPGPWPTVLVFTPYYRRFRLAPGASAEPSPNIAIYRDMFVPRGYALLVVDVRGTGASDGCRDSFRSPRERADYADVIGWATGEPWCDGRLGATGISYLGAAADFAAASGHPALKAIAPISAVWDTYRDHFYPGGCRLTRLIDAYAALADALDQDDRAALTAYPYFADPAFEGPAPVDDDPEGAHLAKAIAQHAANANMRDFLRAFEFRDDALAHDPGFTMDRVSPHAGSPDMRADLAVLAISGWYDGAYANGAISRFLSAPGADRRLLLGPWDHGARTNASPWRARAAPEFPVLAEILRFFDTHVAGRQTGLSEEARVHLHMIGRESWLAAPGWPVAGRSQDLALGPGGTLSAEPGPAARAAHWVDYAQGTGRATRYTRLAAQAIERYYPRWEERRPTDLAFATAPLDAPLALAGDAVLHLALTADQRDACVFAYLEAIAPDGARTYITEGMLRALHRGGAERSPTYRATWPTPSFHRAEARPLTPGEPARLQIPFLPVAWEIPAGHRLGLRLAGADRDNFALWPYGAPGRWVVALGSGGSRLSLPILSASAI